MLVGLDGEGDVGLAEPLADEIAVVERAGAGPGYELMWVSATVSTANSLLSGAVSQLDWSLMPRRNRQEKKRSTPEDSGSSRGGRGSGRLPRVEPTGVVRPLPPHLAKPVQEEPATD